MSAVFSPKLPYRLASTPHALTGSLAFPLFSYKHALASHALARPPCGGAEPSTCAHFVFFSCPDLFGPFISLPCTVYLLALLACSALVSSACLFFSFLLLGPRSSSHSPAPCSASRCKLSARHPRVESIPFAETKKRRPKKKFEAQAHSCAPPAGVVSALLSTFFFPPLSKTRDGVPQRHGSGPPTGANSIGRGECSTRRLSRETIPAQSVCLKLAVSKRRLFLFLGLPTAVACIRCTLRPLFYTPAGARRRH